MCDVTLYTHYVDGIPVKYAYGEPWVAMALYMDDIGYDTPEEAIDAWNKMKKNEVPAKTTPTDR